MMYIDKSLDRIIKAEQLHYSGLIDQLYERIDSKITDPKSVQLFDFFINPFLDIIINGSPSEIIKFSKEINLIANEKFIDDIKSVFQYKGWFDQKKKTLYDAYDLAKNLDIPVCTYCNRMYTKTVFDEEGEKITRPTFDHWFAKDDHPLLALSFYNLIPSCNICNSSVKGKKELSLGEHFHPYIDLGKEINKQIVFSYYNKKLKSFGFNVRTPKDSKAEKTVKFFKLKEIYETHEDEISDLLRLKDVYSDKYLQMLRKNILKGTSISDKEIYRLAFGTHIDDAQFDRRPLSKMKKDILNELGILKYFKNEF
ncbi:hypothetical protein CEY12_01305 [Chryseobacterium sp. T16E-39]|uniref:hypothetical protein n=1 Tax=Chryseobacterium sp. T16E-39 TaxID=2015076 RepID=UPI000B5B3654|nr:hypothetical protein [Chryseobacterium sp. T16E-39]ASK28825.1 hypothetical protein CEY12_01305 [Chryseobacterium sp. T16E-39]